MDSEDSRGGGTGDARSSSSSSSSSSRSRRSSSSDKSEISKKDAKSPPRSPPRSPPQSPPQSPPRSPSSQKSEGPRSPSPESRSQSPSPRSPSPAKPPHSPSNLSEAHSDINSPENSMPGSPPGPKSPDPPKSPSDQGSNIGSPERTGQYSAPPSAGEGPKTPQSPSSAPGSPSSRSRPLSPDSASQPISPPQRNPDRHSSSPSPDRAASTSPARSPQVSKKVWSPKDKWRRHTKAEQKMVPMMRERSRSESSQSSRSSSYNKRRSSTKDPATEEISDGEMESDQEDRKSQGKSMASDKNEGKELNISHEDLSDVSDLDSVGPEESEREQKRKLPPASTEMKQEVNLNGNTNASTQSSPKSDNGSAKVETQKLEKVPQEKTSNTEDGEEQLDFEAEEGECIEPKQIDQANGDAGAKGPELEDVKPGRRSRGSSLEEGEVSDEAERPEENEPRPVCRFFSRGACTWGVSCRFLHPGVTDKGNYNMFDVVRGVPAGAPYSAAPPRDTAPPESAWERGLRTAKEMLRIANKRKEQDMDFEEKKLHLSVGGVVHDPDAELAYAAAAVGASPPRLPHDVPHRDPDAFSSGRRGVAPAPAARRPAQGPGRLQQVLYAQGTPLGQLKEKLHVSAAVGASPPRLPHDVPHRDPDAFSRSYGPMYRGRYMRPVDERERYYEPERGYERERERAYERPPHYDERGPVPDEAAYHKRRVRSSREVIVQRAEVERREGREAREPREGREGRDRGERGEREGRPRDGRGDEWADPWMRAEPAARRRRPPSSDESYSSTSSSNSSSRSSRSPSARRKRRASSSSRQRLSPSVIVRERRMATARATAMNPPAPRRRAPSPAAARQLSANPPPPASHRHKDELDPYGRNKASSRNKDRKKYSRSSSSGSETSSSSSESESESHSSSSSGSSGARRARHARLLNAAARPRLNAKASAGLAAAVSTVTSKKEIPSDKDLSGKKRSATSPVDSGPAKKSVSRREELLKQLKAVEDAIARKRSKI